MGNRTIGDYSFVYHDAGYRLEKEDVVCEFDFLPENGFPIKFSNWEVYQFINTNAKWNRITYNLDEIHIELLKLVEKGELVLLEISGVEGPVCVSACTTREQLYEDNANRCILLYMDNSIEQDKKIMDYQRRLSAGQVDQGAEQRIRTQLKNV